MGEAVNTPVCSITHDPQSGVYGDCHRRAVAFALGLSVEEVPHFYDGGASAEVAETHEVQFLSEHGLAKVSMPLDPPFKDALNVTQMMAPDAPLILGGISGRGLGHSVVVMSGKVVMDSTDSGIVAPFDDGYYWVTFFARKLLTGGARIDG